MRFSLPNIKDLLTKKIKNEFLDVALEKIGFEGITADEAVAIFNDAKKTTTDHLPTLTLDEVAALTMYVASKKTWKQRIIAAIGVIVTIIMGYMGGNLAPVVSPATTALQDTAATVVIPDTRKQAAIAWVQSNACEHKPCTITSVVMSPTGSLLVNVVDGELAVSVETHE